ncbi:hypothetical protein MTO96_001440 [Rhipicephalus appendiculatus]
MRGLARPDTAPGAKAFPYPQIGTQDIRRAANAPSGRDREAPRPGEKALRAPLQPCHWKTKNATRTYTLASVLPPQGGVSK